MIRLRRRRAPPDGRMTVVEHLSELRQRLIKSTLAFLGGSIVAFVFRTSLLNVLIAPLDEGGRIGGVRVTGLNVGGITTGFTVALKVSVFFGLVFALPVILWQVWRFIVPGLEPRERRFGIWFVVASLGLFALGTAVAFLMLPKAIGFLLQFAREPLTPLIFVDQYLSFVSFMVIAFGLSFEFPLLLTFLAAVGIVSSRRLAGWRRQAVFVAFLVGAVATPSQDPYTMTLLAVPLYLMFEASLLIIRFGMKK